MLNRRISRIAANRNRIPPLLAGIALGLVLAGCAVNKAPRFNYGPDGEKIQFKRYEKYIAMDYLHHIGPIVYNRTDALPLGPMLSDGQQEILQKKGKPDYVRNDYYSKTDEVVTDWVYYNQDLLYQFVEGELVFEGPVTDYEKVLIRRGRPEEATVPENQTGRRSDVLSYRNIIKGSLDTYVFSNGKLVGATLN